MNMSECMDTTFKKLKKKTFDRIGRICVFVDVCVCDSARKQEARTTDSVRLIKGVFGRGSLLVGVCLFIHSLSTLY